MPPKKYKTNPIVKKISDIKVKTKNKNKTRKLLEKVIKKYKQHLKTKDSSRPTSSPVSFDLGVPALPLDEALIEASKHDPMIPRNDIPPIDIPEIFIPPAWNNLGKSLIMIDLLNNSFAGPLPRNLILVLEPINFCGLAPNRVANLIILCKIAGLAIIF